MNANFNTNRLERQVKHEVKQTLKHKKPQLVLIASIIGAALAGAAHTVSQTTEQ
jgi:hypothetical protein